MHHSCSTLPKEIPPPTPTPRTSEPHQETSSSSSSSSRHSSISTAARSVTKEQKSAPPSNKKLSTASDEASVEEFEKIYESLASEMLSLNMAMTNDIDNVNDDIGSHLKEPTKLCLGSS